MKARSEKKYTIVDATIVDSPYHPHLPKNLVIAGDRESRWVSGGKVSRFGFKHHVVEWYCSFCVDYTRQCDRHNDV